MVNVTICVDAGVKRACERIYGELGVDLSTAINVFLRKSIQAGGFPFDVRLGECPASEPASAPSELVPDAHNFDAKRDPNAGNVYQALEDLLRHGSKQESS